ncbi:MAG: hypothetical protein RI568_12325 [Natronomonas sp.]|jgi:hypothetical protein|uniref:DUF7344 domain-containing protein n=1 Tax=Natronomonas sp. TaxID=2184060 RepID=UPI002870087B|nr:hypothetical protein [Natronomonas sp.]MDR9431468.1 hypothetical protein [Natronomonas sp.]
MVIDRLRSGVSPREEAETRSIARRRHRAVVRCLSKAGPMAFDELVNRVAIRERELDAGPPDPDHHAAVYASLSLTHVPALIDAGVVAYDADTRRIALTDRGHRFRNAAATRTEHGVWNRAFLAQSFVWIVVVLAARLDVAPLAGIPALWLVGCCVGTTFVTSIGYAWWAHRPTAWTYRRR